MPLPKSLRERLSLPIVGAPMFLASGVDLVVAQCCAGMVGSFPALNARPQEELDIWLGEIKERIEKHNDSHEQHAAPYAVNLIVHSSNARLEHDLMSCVRHEVPIIITSLAAPDEVVEKAHSYGGLVFHDVISLRHARKAAAAGVDGLILVCAGAGGHGGTLNPFAFVNEVRQFFDGIIILAGTISDGRAIAAAKMLGCDLVYMGTRFLASKESFASAGHKDMIIESKAEDILYTPLFSGAHGNYLIPSIVAAGVELEEARAARPRKMQFNDGKPRPKLWKDIWGAGQGVGAIQELLCVKEIFQHLKAEYDAALAQKELWQE